jgi:hypothetical protein
MIASFKNGNRAVPIGKGRQTSGMKLATSAARIHRNNNSTHPTQLRLPRPQRGNHTPSPLVIGALGSSRAENLFVVVLAGASALAVLYSLTSGIGLVGNWPVFRAGIERLLG